ncbi:hypothetical protein FOZ63_006818, partial [Perkinsus olseni]
PAVSLRGLRRSSDDHDYHDPTRTLNLGSPSSTWSIPGCCVTGINMAGSPGCLLAEYMGRLIFEMLSSLVVLLGVAHALPLAWQPTVDNCTEGWIKQNRDHFSFGKDSDPGEFDQRNVLEATGEYHSQPARRRYFTFADFYRPGGPLFFYVGNEGPVEIYVNHTGLMWELGSDLGALLVFAEHRYYGGTLVYPDGTPDCLRYLTIEQALADYSVLIDHLFDEYALPASTATIA